MPLISIIIPCYRQAHYLSQAVRSALEQTVTDIEVVVVDDGSPDDPQAHIRELARDSRFIYVRQENQGLPAARNAGVRASSGALLNFLDADDWLAPEFCGRLVPVLQRDPALGFAYCDVIHVHEPSERGESDKPQYSVGRSRRITTGHILPSLLLGGYFSPQTVLVPRSVLDRVGLFDPELGGHADWDLWLRIAAAGYPVRYVDEKLAYYRIHSQSMSRNAEHMRATRLQALRKLLRAAPDAVAGALDDLCRTADEQFQANQFLQEQFRRADSRLAHLMREQAQDFAQTRAWIARLEEACRWHEEQARNWRTEAERLGGIEVRFANYFRESQAWIASLETAKTWHEQQAQSWKDRAERRSAAEQTGAEPPD